MGKPWAKYEVGFVNHPKFLALSGNGIGLWLEGKSYADRHLTEGFLPTAIVKRFRFFSVRNVAALIKSCGLKHENGAFSALWMACPGGWQMHDYLDYNDSRAVSLERIAEAEGRAGERRERNREYKRKMRDGKAARRWTDDASPSVSAMCQQHVTLGVSSASPLMSPLMSAGCQQRVSKKSPSITETETETETETDLSREQRASNAIVEDAIAMRGARALERYQVLYAKHRRGAHYRPRPNLDWLDACDLCRHWDDARLEKLAVLVLTTDDEWIAKTDRSFKIFAMKASAMDDRLAQWEAEQGRKVGR